MKIISWNVNGIRACFAKNGLSECIESHDPDIVFLQEIKAKEEQAVDIITFFSEYDVFFHSAHKPGYAGTAVMIKKQLSNNFSIIRGIEGFDDIDGRIVGVENETTIFLGIYFQNGGKSPEAWREKLWFYNHLIQKVQNWDASHKKVIFCGDINVAQNAIDLARPKDNEGAIGFHPLERAEIEYWHALGFVDAWRRKNPYVKNQYSWWSYRAGARPKNVGWRIDSFFMHHNFLPHINSIFYDIHQMGSDHCPVVLDIDL